MEELKINLYRKIKDIGIRISQWWDKQVEENKQMQLRQESVSCPHCHHTHSGSYYDNNATKSESLRFTSDTGSCTDINFLKCFSCEQVFGVKTSHYYDPVPSLVRSNFCIIEEINNKGS